MTDRIEPRAGEIGTGGFRGPYYNFVGRVGPYPQGPTTKGIHTPPDGEFPASELAVDDQTANEAPTTEKLLQTPPPSPREGEEGEGYDPLNPELEPEPGEPGVPVTTEQPAFAYGDPGTGLENIHGPDEPNPPDPPEPEPVTISAVRGLGDEVVFTLGGGVGPYTLGPGDATADQTGLAAGDVPYTYAANGTYTATSTDSETTSQTTQVIVDWLLVTREGDDEWQRLTRHADIDDYLDGRKDLTRPDNWMGLTVADKKAWLDENAR